MFVILYVYVSTKTKKHDIKTQIHFENLKMFLHLWFVPLLVELLSRGYYTWMGDCRCGQINHITYTKVNSAFYPLVA